MKTKFLYFPGMFENPAPAKYCFKKSKIIWNIHYYSCRRARRCPGWWKNWQFILVYNTPWPPMSVHKKISVQSVQPFGWLYATYTNVLFYYIEEDIRMHRKIIDDYCLYYLNDLFGIALIILRSQLNVATFRICMDATFFSRF